MYSKVLIPLDGFELAESILSHVREMIDGRHIMEVILLTVVEGSEKGLPSTTWGGVKYAEYKAELTAEAMADARAKAEQLADLAGVRLDKPTYISETFYTPPMYSRAAYDIEEAAAGTPISPGELDISISLQVAYAIR